MNRAKTILNHLIGGSYGPGGSSEVDQIRGLCDVPGLMNQRHLRWGTSVVVGGKPDGDQHHQV